jgi:hypothetical protein
MPTPHFSQSLLKKIFFIVIMIISVAGSIGSGIEIARLIAARRATPYFFNGNKVAGLNRLLAGEKYIGYYSDRDQQKDTSAFAQFTQLQLEMAPLLLDKDNLNHRFIIFDCIDAGAMMKKGKELGTNPVSRNNFGLVLAIRQGL